MFESSVFGLTCDSIETDRGIVTSFDGTVTSETANKIPPKNSKPKKRHICQLCNKEFTKKCGLTTHLLIHAGVKPFICEICFKTFTKKCTLTVHLLTHSSERPFVCEICDKAFARKTDLQKHNFVHSGEKRYVCDVCKTGFTHQNNLRRHKLKHLPKDSTVSKRKDVLSCLLVDNERNRQLFSDKSKLSSGSLTTSTNAGPEVFKDVVKKLHADVRNQLIPETNESNSLNESINLMGNEVSSISDIVIDNIKVSSTVNKSLTNKKEPQILSFANIDIDKLIQINGSILKEAVCLGSQNPVHSDMIGCEKTQNSKALNKVIDLKNTQELSLDTLESSAIGNPKAAKKSGVINSIELPNHANIDIDKLIQINGSVLKETVNLDSQNLAHSDMTDCQDTPDSKALNKVINMKNTQELALIDTVDSNGFRNHDGARKDVNSIKLSTHSNIDIDKLIQTTGSILKETANLDSQNLVHSDMTVCHETLGSKTLNKVINLNNSQELPLIDIVESSIIDNHKTSEKSDMNNIELPTHTNIDIDKLIQISGSILKEAVNLDSQNSVHSNMAGCEEILDSQVLNGVINLKNTQESSVIDIVENSAIKKHKTAEKSDILNNIELPTHANIDIDKLIEFNDSVILKETVNLKDSLETLHMDIAGYKKILHSDSEVSPQNNALSVEENDVSAVIDIVQNKAVSEPGDKMSAIINDINLSTHSNIDIDKLIKFNDSVILKETVNMKDSLRSLHTDITGYKEILCDDAIVLNQAINLVGNQDSPFISVEQNVNITEPDLGKDPSIMNTVLKPNHTTIDIDKLIKFNDSIILKEVVNIKESIISLQTNVTECKEILCNDTVISNPVLHQKDMQKESVIDVQNKIGGSSNSIINNMKLQTYTNIDMGEKICINTSVNTEKANHLNNSPIPLPTELDQYEQVLTNNYKVSTKASCFNKIQESLADKVRNIPIKECVASTASIHVPTFTIELNLADQPKISKDTVNMEDALASILINMDKDEQILPIDSAIVDQSSNLHNIQEPLLDHIENKLVAESEVPLHTVNMESLQIPLQNDRLGEEQFLSSKLVDLKSIQKVFFNDKIQLATNSKNLQLGTKNIHTPTLHLDQLANQKFINSKSIDINDIEESLLNDIENNLVHESKVLQMTAPMENHHTSSYMDILGKQGIFNESINLGNELSVNDNILPLFNDTQGKMQSTAKKSEIVKEIVTNKDKDDYFCFKGDKQAQILSGKCHTFKEAMKTIQLALPSDRDINEKTMVSKSMIVEQAVDTAQVLPIYNDLDKESLTDESLSNLQELYSCDNCGKIFDDKDKLSSHVPSHVDRDHYQCYLCDENFSNTDLLQMHVLTHSEDTIEDMDAISLDEDFDAAKFGPLTPGDISLEEIDKIGLDEDFDEKVARMYALAHVEVASKDANSDDDDLYDDDEATKVYTLSQTDFSIEEIDETHLKKSQVIETDSVHSTGLAERIDKVCAENSVENSNKQLDSFAPIEITHKSINIISGDLAHDGFSDNATTEPLAISMEAINNTSGIKSYNISSKLHSKISKSLQKNMVQSYVSGDSINDLLDIDLSEDEEFYAKDFEELELANSDLCEESVFSQNENFEENLGEINADIMNKVQALADIDLPEDNISQETTINQNPKLNSLEMLNSSKISQKINALNLIINEDADVDSTKKSYTCHICEKTFARKQYLQTHYLMHAGIKPYICEICYKTFTKKCSLTIHSLIHTGEKKHSCNECKKTFGRKTDLQKHSLIHSGHKPFTCDVCHKGFSHQNNLRRHKLIHLNKKLHVCDICSQRFSERVNLLTHMKIHIKEAEINEMNGNTNSNISSCLKSIKDKLHACEDCGMLFARKDRLLKHKATHVVRTLHPCEVCGSTFKNRDQLQIHLLNHIDIAFDDIEDNVNSIEDLDLMKLEPSLQKIKKTHACNQCFKVYTRNSALKCHYLTHTGERPHECHICQKRFAQRTTLKRHILAHSGIKPYRCEICNKSFAREPSLRKHYVTHTSIDLI